MCTTIVSQVHAHGHLEFTGQKVGVGDVNIMCNVHH